MVLFSHRGSSQRRQAKSKPAKYSKTSKVFGGIAAEPIAIVKIEIWLKAATRIDSANR